jgi:hypothetical protein
MHHKRGRAKNARSGCLMCKPHKVNGAKGGLNAQPRQELRSRLNAKEQVAELGGQR